MSKSAHRHTQRPVIRLRGVRQNNLKNIDLDLPTNELIVVTGLSGSGKSSLAFDTLFAEGQRRYIETFSPYARQFFDRMDKPRADSIEGIPPAIAIEQRNSVRSTRSTVGTMTEICDYFKVLWPKIAQLHCRQCGQLVRKEPPKVIRDALLKADGPAEILVTFDVPLSEKLSVAESLTLISKQGYQRLLLGTRVARLEEARSHLESSKPAPGIVTVIQDRVSTRDNQRGRFVEACEQAYHFGKGRLTLWELGGADETRNPRRFSQHLHCSTCDIEYRESSPALFSFNHPLGACPKCRGFGRIITIDYHRAIPDRSRTIAEGVVRPWAGGVSAECQRDLLKVCRTKEIPTNVPFAQLPAKTQTFVVEGDPEYGSDEEHQWPRVWYGVKGYFRWLESQAYKMHLRVLLSRYRAYLPCPDCRGDRFQPDALLYLLNAPEGNATSLMTLADFYRLPIRDALRILDSLATGLPKRANDPLALAFGEVRSRLAYLEEVGLGYLTLDRPTRSLSGGETERVNLTTCLGSRLVNTLFVLDEPSVGLHARDTGRLVRILERLRDAGNTVLVVEHEAAVMRAADRILDLGPGHGTTGGALVFEGEYSQILESDESLTGRYLSGRQRIEIPTRRTVELNGILETDSGIRPRHSRQVYPDARATWLKLHDRPAPPTAMVEPPTPVLRLSHATHHNLNDVSVTIPLGRFVCVTGVSGSGKTTLTRDVLLPALEARLNPDPAPVASPGAPEEEGETGEDPNRPASASLEGWEQISNVVWVNQATLGKTPRSNPAVYAGAFDDIRTLFANSEPARRKGLQPGAFSFNSISGKCPRCGGLGFEKIEMQFLSDVFIRCPDCDGRRYRPEIRGIKIRPSGAKSGPALSIADLLDVTIEEGANFLEAFTDSTPAQRAAARLRLLNEVGLGYLKLGQPINTLSGGESQRLKLVAHLADSEAAGQGTRVNSGKGLFFVFDEPTTGLHFDDVRVLLNVFQRLVDSGHSVLVIEHNLDVIKCADWVIDLGPEAGDQGGRVVAEGTPEQIAACAESFTGQALGPLLRPGSPRAARGEETRRALSR